MAIRESESETSGDFLSSVFSLACGGSSVEGPGRQSRVEGPLTSRWPSINPSRTSVWTKYCLLCTVSGAAATLLAGIFLIVAALLRHHTTSIHYFETVPTYTPSILLSISGVSTMAFSCKRNRNIVLLRITACWSLCSAALSSVITITTSLIHMNRLQTLKECVYSRNSQTCTCFGHSYPTGPLEIKHHPSGERDVVHGVLYSCLRAVFAISVLGVLLSIFICMLLYQLIGHERKKAYWSRIRRINTDSSFLYLSCLSRPFPNSSSLSPLILSRSRSVGVEWTPSMVSMRIPSLSHYGPPPPYEPTEQPSLPDRYTTQVHLEGTTPQPQLQLRDG